MARFDDHLAFDRFFVGSEQPQVHRETDKGWSNGSALAHMAAHTPLYGLLVVFPRHGPQGLASHIWHVAADMSPLQIRDIAEDLGVYRKGE